MSTSTTIIWPGCLFIHQSQDRVDGLCHFFILHENFNVKLDENIRFCMDMFSYDNVDTMLMKKRQKFLGGYEEGRTFAPWTSTPG